MKKEWLEIRATQVTEVVIKGVDLLKKIRKSKAKNNKVVKVVEEMKQVGVEMLRDKKWREKNGLMLKNKKVYVPRDEKLRAEVIWLYHDMPVEGHEG